MSMNLYDVKGYDRPLLLSEEHAEVIGATRHQTTRRPKNNASLTEWQEHATGLGVQPDVLEGMTRAQVIEHVDTHYYDSGQV
jgi:hypothetical protein